MNRLRFVVGMEKGSPPGGGDGVGDSARRVTNELDRVCAVGMRENKWGRVMQKRL